MCYKQLLTNPTSRKCVVCSSPVYNTSSHQLLTNPTSRQCVVRSSPFYNTSSRQVLVNPTSRQCVGRSNPFYPPPPKIIREPRLINEKVVFYKGLELITHFLY